MELRQERTATGSKKFKNTVHVKGKQPAPKRPTYVPKSKETVTSTSTLQRKKRRAPLPPHTSVLMKYSHKYSENHGLVNDKKNHASLILNTSNLEHWNKKNILFEQFGKCEPRAQETAENFHNITNIKSEHVQVQQDSCCTLNSSKITSTINREDKIEITSKEAQNINYFNGILVESPSPRMQLAATDKKNFEEEQAHLKLTHTNKKFTETQIGTASKWICPYCTFKKFELRIDCDVCGKTYPCEKEANPSKNENAVNDYRKESFLDSCFEENENNLDATRMFVKNRQKDFLVKSCKLHITNTKTDQLKSNNCCFVSNKKTCEPVNTSKTLLESSEALVPPRHFGTNSDNLDKIHNGRLQIFFNQEFKTDGSKKNGKKNFDDTLELEKKFLKLQAMNFNVNKYPIVRENKLNDVKSPSCLNIHTKEKQINFKILKENTLGEVQWKNNSHRKLDNWKDIPENPAVTTMYKDQKQCNMQNKIPNSLIENNVKSSYVLQPIHRNNQFDKIKKYQTKFPDAQAIENSEAHMLPMHQIESDLFIDVCNTSQSLNEDNFLNKTDPITLNNMMENLEISIAEGQLELAAKLAINLAKMKVLLQVTKLGKDGNHKSITHKSITPKEEYILLVELNFEDQILPKRAICLQIKPLMTISKLKEMVQEDFKIPTNFQKWLTDDGIISDENKTLLECGVKHNLSYLQLHVCKNSYSKLSNILDASCLQQKNEIGKKYYNLNKIICENSRKSKDGAIPCIGYLKLTQSSTIHKDINETSFKEYEYVDKRTSVTSEIKNDLNISTNSFSQNSNSILNIIEDNVPLFGGQSDNPVPIVQKTLKDLYSPNITRNKYRGVDNFNPHRRENASKSVYVPEKRISSKETSNISPKSTYPINHYLEIVKLDSSDIVPNGEAFVCPVCFVEVKKYNGVVLRECLHTFCRECLASCIIYSENVLVKCPYLDKQYSCECNLQEREIKSLVSIELYENHLEKSVREAEHKIKNTFHCKTHNCRGWCIFEDKADQFKCPVCKITNCLKCRIVHDGLSCKQYKDRLKNDVGGDVVAKETRDMLKEIIQSGEAMNCPTCQVIILKKWGCDWLTCSICKTEICWATRGPRWGQRGKGDNSGGCKCGVDGKKCHINCNYCH